MTRNAIAACSFALLLLAAEATATPAAPAAKASQPAAPGATSAAIDRDVWGPVAASVSDDDIVAMGRTYHPAAVLVAKDGTKLIAAALDGWGKDIQTAKKNGVRATVAFRFSTRRDDATSAFETGIFKYTTTDRAGVSTSSYTTMEALLTNYEGAWRILMEHQLGATTEAAWNALPAGR
ncbi:MAG: hypothetical protein ABI880_03915 [Acidobacteriota bacterium]